MNAYGSRIDLFVAGIGGPTGVSRGPRWVPSACPSSTTQSPSPNARSRTTWKIREGLDHRLKACTDGLPAFRWLYVLRVSLNDRRKVEAEEALHVVIVERLVPRIQQADVICHTHLDSPPPFTRGPWVF